MILRKIILTGILTLSPFLANRAMAATDNTMIVYKTPWCGCCKIWVEKLEKAGFTITVEDMEDLSSIKKQASVTKKLEGCHTAVLGEYVLEGHVPLAAIKKLLTEKPNIRGIAVPGMPQGSLGMGFNEDAKYKVFSFHFDTKKSASVYFESGV